MVMDMASIDLSTLCEYTSYILIRRDSFKDFDKFNIYVYLHDCLWRRIYEVANMLYSIDQNVVIGADIEEGIDILYLAITVSEKDNIICDDINIMQIFKHDNAIELIEIYMFDSIKHIKIHINPLLLDRDIYELKSSLETITNKKIDLLKSYDRGRYILAIS